MPLIFDLTKTPHGPEAKRLEEAISEVDRRTRKVRGFVYVIAAASPVAAGGAWALGALGMLSAPDALFLAAAAALAAGLASMVAAGLASIVVTAALTAALAAAVGLVQSVIPGAATAVTAVVSVVVVVSMTAAVAMMLTEWLGKADQARAALRSALDAQGSI